MALNACVPSCGSVHLRENGSLVFKGQKSWGDDYRV